MDHLDAEPDRSHPPPGEPRRTQRRRRRHRASESFVKVKHWLDAALAVDDPWLFGGGS